MKVGQRIVIQETNEKGVVESINEKGFATSVKLDTGEIINTISLTVKVLNLLTSLITAIKGLFKSSKN